MKKITQNPTPYDAEKMRSAKPVICYSADSVKFPNFEILQKARLDLTKTAEYIIPPRDAYCFEVPAGHFFRIVSIEGPQVADLNLWHKDNLDESFFAGKTRALYGTHLSVEDRLWSKLPYLRSLATITYDTLDWYGFDDDGGSVHDVIGTRCDPYTKKLLSGDDYHHCCHSNLLRALADYTGLPLDKAEPYIHDVLNVFMCTGFTKDTHQYFMKASPVRPGDYLEFFAELDLIAGLSACPGGDCSSEHSSDSANCHPLLVEVYQPASNILNKLEKAKVSSYVHKPTS